MCYAPVFDERNEVKDAFWDTSNDTIGICDHEERIILLGDMNGWVEVLRESTEKVVGYFVVKKMNGNGDKLVCLCSGKGLFITNTWFRHKMIHLCNWCGGDSHSIIDFVIADERLRVLVRDTRVLRGSDCEKDPYLLVLKIKLCQG